MDLAIATVRLRSLSELGDADDVLYEGDLLLPDGKLALGDADSEVSLNAAPASARVRVHSAIDPEYGVTDVRIDDIAPT
ncbi:MAG: hypothetical protein ACT4QF_08140 [Sporichthyaceae bacterium]